MMALACSTVMTNFLRCATVLISPGVRTSAYRNRSFLIVPYFVRIFETRATSHTASHLLLG